MTVTTLDQCPLLLGGDWVRDPTWPAQSVHNPSTGEALATVPLCGAPEVERAVGAAAAAYPAWRDTPPLERARVLFRYRDLLERNFNEVAQLITREHGKTLEEARGSLRRGIEVVEFASGIPTLLMGDSLENIAPGMDCDSVRQPLGVCGGITPFNFPAMVPLWMFPIALACGNTFVFKPSEQVPLAAVRMVELLVEAGLPAGVLNLVHGRQEAVDALLTHPVVQAVSFVGSSPVARHVYQTAAAHGKRVQAAAGAKNFMLVLPDANLDAAVPGMMTSAVGCAGERCMAGSVVVTVGGGHDRVRSALVDAVAAIRVGPTDRDGAADMGPVVSASHLERVHNYIDIGLDEGAALARDGRGLQVAQAPGGYYLGPTIFDAVQPGMRIAKDEIFGPVLALMELDELDTAIDLINRSGYGNGASIFTQSGKAARRFRNRVGAGMVGINVGVPASMAFFPFSGWSGSFYGDLHMQGKEGVAFYTRQKVTMSRWP